MSIITQQPLRRGSDHAQGASLSNICVGIATRGRPEVLAATVDRLRHQSLAPRSIIISCTGPADVEGLPPSENLTVVTGPAGSCRQRNLIWQFMPAETDIVVFFDDDFVAHADWLAAVAHCFSENRDVGAVTGRVLADGIKGPGIPFEKACAIADAAEYGADTGALTPFIPYGCNMAFRCSAIDGLSFDERLVLYGWLEDRDFGGRIAQRGWRSVKLNAARGVHMGVKTGRMPGRKLGYSQVMNPFYMNGKGSMDRRAVIDHVFRNIASNLARSIRPEAYIDRRGRLHGNALALLDLVRGRITPERAELI